MRAAAGWAAGSNQGQLTPAAQGHSPATRSGSTARPGAPGRSRPLPGAGPPPFAVLRAPRGRASSRLALPALGPGSGRKRFPAPCPWSPGVRAARGRAHPGGQRRRPGPGDRCPGWAAAASGWVSGGLPP